MATHPRQAIREAVAAQLVDTTAAADRIRESRELSWRYADLPGISVYTLEEASEAATNDRGLKRSLSLAILGIVSLTENVDDALDSLAQEIEDAVNLDPTFGRTALGSVLTATDVEIVEEQNRPIGAIRLTYEVRYFT